MAQTNNENGVSSYIVHNEKTKDVEVVRVDGVYTNIAFDDIDYSILTSLKTQALTSLSLHIQT